jgi:hypothetical protein
MNVMRLGRTHPEGYRVTGAGATRAALTVVTVAGLAVDAYVHLHLASDYDAVKTTVLSQGELFRAEGSAAIVVAVALLVRPRRYTAVLAALLGAAGLAAVLVYRYVNIKAFGPIPAMYEPIWYGDKTRSAYAEGSAAVAGAALAILRR